MYGVWVSKNTSSSASRGRAGFSKEKKSPFPWEAHKDGGRTNLPFIKGEKKSSVLQRGPLGKKKGKACRPCRIGERRGGGFAGGAPFAKHVTLLGGKSGTVREKEETGKIPGGGKGKGTLRERPVPPGSRPLGEGRCPLPLLL